jgi:hypothetical protein
MTYKSILLAKAEVKFLGSDIDENIESLLDQIRLSAVTVSVYGVRIVICALASYWCVRCCFVQFALFLMLVSEDTLLHHIISALFITIITNSAPALHRRSSCTPISCVGTSTASLRSAKRRDARCRWTAVTHQPHSSS